jgi:hypothetical protein
VAATRRTATFLALATWLAAPLGWAQERPTGLDDWWTRPASPPAQVAADSQPGLATLDLLKGPANQQTLSQSGRDGDWQQVIDTLRQQTQHPDLRERLVRSPELLLGAQEAARRRLTTWIQRGRAYPPLVAAEAEELLGRARHEGAAAWRRAIDRFPASPAAGVAALRLAESLAEDGRVDAAIFVLRAHAHRPEVARRLRLLRALPGEGSPWWGQRGLPPPPGAPLQLLWARRSPSPAGVLRPLVADRHRVYLTDRLGVAAVARSTGLLAWRAEPQRPAPLEVRLALGHGLLLHLTPQRLRALRVEDGSESWSLALDHQDGLEPSPRDRFHAVIASADGVLVLVTLGEVRRLIALSPAGDVRWRTRLWTAPTTLAGQRFAVRYRPRDPRQSATPESPGQHVLAQRVAGSHSSLDGQLACLPGWAFVTLDGLLAAVGQGRGELRWVRARAVARAVAGEHHTVSLEAAPYELNAVLRGGLLMRVDPLTGRGLPAPQPPVTVDPAVTAEAYPLAGAHGVLGWRLSSAPDRVQVVQRGASVASLACADVRGPGTVWGRQLVLPGRAGLTLLDLPSGRQRSLPWPAPLGAGRPRAQAGLVLVASGEGVAAYAPAPSAPTPAPLPAGAPAAQIRAALGHPSWRRRWEAQRALVGLTESELVQAGDDSLEASEALAWARTRLQRDARWRRLAPHLSADDRAALWERPTLANLRLALLELPDADCERDLRDELSAIARKDGSALAWPLAEALLRRQPLDQGLVVLEIRQATDAAHAVVAANILVGLAADGGPLEPLQRVVNHPDVATRAVVILQISGRDEVRRRLFADDAAWKDTLEAAWRDLLMRWGAIDPPTPRHVDEVRAHLVDALADE